MQIGIVLDNYESPMEDLENIISSYGLMREVGYLRINPERVPVVMSESKADGAIDRFLDHVAEYDICDIRNHMEGFDDRFTNAVIKLFGRMVDAKEPDTRHAGG